MSGDLISLRILIVSGSAPDREFFRQAAASAAIPTDVMEVDNPGAAQRALGAVDIDIAFVDSTIAAQDIETLVAAARLARKPPFIFVAQAAGDSVALPGGDKSPDGVVAKPANLDEAKSLIGRATRARVPSRVLLVDDSSTMRSIVRKILSGSRFPLDVAEAQEGIEALKQIATGKFDFVFLDYNMPGLNGVETLSEIKRQYPRLEVVIMTATQDDAIAERAREAGAAAFLKKPFFPADIDALLLHRICGPRPRG